VPPTAETSFESENYFTQQEFAHWVEHVRWDDLARYELLNGRIVMNPPTGWPQGESELGVASVLRTFVRSQQLGRVFAPNQGFELPSGDTVGPDASFVSRERWAAGAPYEPNRFLPLVPDLVVEVLSVSTRSRDRGEKKAIYERNGVREYWLIDCMERTMKRFVLDAGRFGQPVTFADGAPGVSAILEGLVFPPEDVFVEP
jgi:Uma2 family endonuclease